MFLGPILGICIGDGHITNKNRLIIRHCIAQQNYALFKKQRLEYFFGKSINHYFYNYHEYPSIQYSVSHPLLKYIRKLLYPNGIKIISQEVLSYLTPEAIAFWYMDDGSLSQKKRDGKIHAYELSISTYCSELEADIMILYFSSIWGISFTKRINRGKYTIRCGTREARKFIYLVRNFIHPDMFYKINISYAEF